MAAFFHLSVFMRMGQMNLHIGSNFDDFLLEEGLAEAVMEPALKRVLIWQLMQAIKRCHALRRDGANAEAETPRPARTISGISVETASCVT